MFLTGSMGIEFYGIAGSVMPPKQKKDLTVSVTVFAKIYEVKFELINPLISDYYSTKIKLGCRRSLTP